LEVFDGFGGDDAGIRARRFPHSAQTLRCAVFNRAKSSTPVTAE
jgi:hypothetical protein